ncbi:MAG TPA: hypothetical protein VF618_25100 [Thermoanaerobaculia bacterium]
MALHISMDNDTNLILVRRSVFAALVACTWLCSAVTAGLVGGLLQRVAELPAAYAHAIAFFAGALPLYPALAGIAAWKRIEWKPTFTRWALQFGVAAVVSGAVYTGVMYLFAAF